MTVQTRPTPRPTEALTPEEAPRRDFAASATSETEPPAPRRNRFCRLRPMLLLLVLVGASLGANWWWSVARFIQSTDNAYVQGDIATLSPRIEGDVAAILVADNQVVRSGDPLIRLEDRDWRARLAGAEAGLAEAEAALATLHEQTAQQGAQIATAEAQAAQAEAERVRAVADYRRAGELAGRGYGSRQAADRALADQRKAEAALAAAQATLAAQRQALPVLDAQIRQAEARRDSAQSALQLARSNLEYTVIRAPFDGIAGNRAAQVGQHVRPGQQLIAVAPPPERQFVVANFKETQVARMRPGQPASLAVDAIPGRELHARVDSFAPATGSLFSLLPPENATGNFTKIVQRLPVKLVLEPGQDTAALARLRPGLSVQAEVDTRDDPGAPRGLLGAAAAALRGLAE